MVRLQSFQQEQRKAYMATSEQVGPELPQCGCDLVIAEAPCHDLRVNALLSYLEATSLESFYILGLYF